MGIYRTYFDKNTTIISNSALNTARNPIVQLFYGKTTTQVNEYSRFLFHFDTSAIQSLISGGTISSGAKHTLKMKNTSFFDGELIAADFEAKKRAYSFDLILFRINEYWDEGAGYDVMPNIYETENNNAYILGPSNWLYRTTIDTWSTPGIFDYNTTFPDIIATQHFQYGNEDIEIDITNEINTILTGGANYGYGICFQHEYEITTGTTQQQYVGFYSKYTNTYYEPFIETTWDDCIKDDRGYFFMGKTNKIFYYAYVNGETVNLDTLPTVKITDENGTIIISGTASQLTKGVYYFEFMIPENPNLDHFQYTDTWSLTYNGQSKTVTGKITLLTDNNFLPSLI